MIAKVLFHKGLHTVSSSSWPIFVHSDDSAVVGDNGPFTVVQTLLPVARLLVLAATDDYYIEALKLVHYANVGDHLSFSGHFQRFSISNTIQFTPRYFVQNFFEESDHKMSLPIKSDRIVIACFRRILTHNHHITQTY